MKLNDVVKQKSDEGKSVDKITDYILERLKEEDRKRTIQRIEKLFK